MTAKLSLGQYVFRGTRKGIVIEKTGAFVTICWLDRGGQCIEESVLSSALTLEAGKDFSADFDALVEVALAANRDLAHPPVDRGTVACGLLASFAMFSLMVGFVSSIVCAWVV